MPNSFSQPTEIRCPECGQPVPADVWLIVDGLERPDLLAQVADDTLHDLTCNACGYSGGIDAPLLLYLPDRERKLAFSPPRQATPEQSRQVAGALIGLLSQSAGPNWQNEWVTGMDTVPPGMAGVYLKDGPQAVEQAVQAFIEQMKKNNPESYAELQAEIDRQKRLQEFLAAETWDESRRILEAHPTLLDPQTDQILADIRVGAEARGDEDTARLIDDHIALLGRCREIGIAAAFEEFGADLEATDEPDGDEPGGEGRLEAVLDAIPEELRYEFLHLIESTNSAEEFEAALADRPDLQMALSNALTSLGLA
jgi:hypothetical protein